MVMNLQMHEKCIQLIQFDLTFNGMHFIIIVVTIFTDNSVIPISSKKILEKVYTFLTILCYKNFEH